MKINYTFILLVFFLTAQTVLAQEASLRGRVTDAFTNEPLPFVNVIISGTNIGTITDESGNFLIIGLTPGFVRVEASFVGYKKGLSPEVEASNAKTTFVEIRLEKTDQQIEEVKVTASPFRKTEESPLSLKTIGLSEIEKSPGANRDISKVIQSFAGVQSSPSFRSDVIIRGGGPSESRFYLDGIEVPNINHFATQGSSGGPLGILNADLIREINYYSGAFPANRGNALSGVLEFSQVDGNNEKVKFRGSVGASEVSATFDGPIGEKTNFIVSTRRSYLELLFGLLELPFLPTFNDLQFKVKTRFDQKNELTLVGLGAIDLFDLNLDIENPDEQQQNILSRIPVNEQWSYTVGAVYKHYGANSFKTVALSRSHLNNSAYKYFENDDSSEDNKILDYQSEEIENKLRVENTTRLSGYKLNFGANLDWVEYLNETSQRRFYNGQILNVNYETDLSLLKWGLFGTISRNFIGDRLILSFGTRFDANNYSSGMNNLLEQFSPRFSASYLLTDQWSMNFNTGRYFQLPAYTSLGYKENGVFVNKENNLKYIQSDHLIGGFEFKPKTNMQFSVEGFLKKYSDYPFSVKDQISLANKGADFGVVGDEEILSSSEGRAYGAEFQARIKNNKGLNLNLSYTLVRSEFEDGNGDYQVSSWDSKHLIVLTSTTPLGREWQIGGRWRFVGGLPYTPYDMEKSSLVEAWNLTGGPYLDNARLNSERFDAFHQLDVRVDKTYYLKKLTLKFYLDIQNFYNFQNQDQDIIVREQDANGNYLTTNNGQNYVLRRVKNTSGNVLPTIGIMLEF